MVLLFGLRLFFQSQGNVKPCDIDIHPFERGGWWLGGGKKVIDEERMKVHNYAL